MDLEVKVPATVANIGPGFDCVGVAIGTHLRLRITASDTLEVVGSQSERPVDENLTVRAFRKAFEFAGEEPPAVRIEELGAYPSARGMGASASAIVAGLVAAKGFGSLDVSQYQLALIAIDLEGHADNVLPSLVGGLVVNASAGWLRLVPTKELSPVLVVSPTKFRTSEARAALPAEVPREDAVANASATAALVLALSGAHPPEALMTAMEDRLHEPYRLPQMPQTLDLHKSLRAEGIPTALAGAGPSLICIVSSDDLDPAVEKISSKTPDGWEVISPGWDVEGARVR